MRFPVCLSGFLLCASLVGCGGSGVKLGEVRGRVTVDGKPVPKATLEFVPTAPETSPSLGVTDKDGNYRLAYSQDEFGAMLGTHNVKITTKAISKDEMPDDGSAVEQVFVAIPKKYAKDGALTAEVKAGSNTINFELDTK